MDSVLNDALPIVTGCLRPTFYQYYSPILAGIQLAELRQQGQLFQSSTLSVNGRALSCIRKETTIPHLFVPAMRKLLSKLSEMSICPAQWIDFKCIAKYSESQSELCREAQHPATWQGFAKICLANAQLPSQDVGRFQSSVYKLGVAPTSICGCGALDQTATHVILECPLHRAPRGYHEMLVLDELTRCWLNNIATSI